MKKIFLLLLLICIATLCSCGDFGKYGPKMHYINMRCDNETLSLEKDDERFKWTIETDDETSTIFSFDYFDDENDKYENWSEFTYETSDGEKFELEYNKFDYPTYEVTGTTTIYISYANASEELKTSINNAIKHQNNSGLLVSNHLWDFYEKIDY